MGLIIPLLSSENPKMPSHLHGEKKEFYAAAIYSLFPGRLLPFPRFCWGAAWILNVSVKKRQGKKKRPRRLSSIAVCFLIDECWKIPCLELLHFYLYPIQSPMEQEQLYDYRSTQINTAVGTLANRALLLLAYLEKWVYRFLLFTFNGKKEMKISASNSDFVLAKHLLLLFFMIEKSKQDEGSLSFHYPIQNFSLLISFRWSAPLLKIG